MRGGSGGALTLLVEVSHPLPDFLPCSLVEAWPGLLPGPFCFVLSLQFISYDERTKDYFTCLSFAPQTCIAVTVSDRQVSLESFLFFPISVTASSPKKEWERGWQWQARALSAGLPGLFPLRCHSTPLK